MLWGMRTLLLATLLLTACAADGTGMSPDQLDHDGGQRPTGVHPLACRANCYYYRSPEYDVPGEPTDVYQAWECTGDPAEVESEYGPEWSAWAVERVGCPEHGIAEGWCRCEPECLVIPEDVASGLLERRDGEPLPACTLEVLIDAL